MASINPPRTTITITANVRPARVAMIPASPLTSASASRVPEAGPKKRSEMAAFYCETAPT
jgi:hypothetical protein